ncbi:uncharacterized protein LOC105212461 [Zeugodacus cucurbitae]|uniref:uncharacterized protein LOC105212461 n=1 Tax=Zeugodacus cucurbitae TaxID=28588 RepID=UPI0023D9292E|nr:uncharacterized protein LOC105212461 [Zeugodacus cucurbitae]
MKSYIVLSFLCCVFATDAQSCNGKSFMFCTADGNVGVCKGLVEQVIIKCASGSRCLPLLPYLGCQRDTSLPSPSPSPSPSSNNVGTCVNHQLIDIHLVDCASYGKCVNGLLKILHCPKNTCFDADRYACVPGKCDNGICVGGGYYSN